MSSSIHATTIITTPKLIINKKGFIFPILIDDIFTSKKLEKNCKPEQLILFLILVVALISFAKSPPDIMKYKVKIYVNFEI